jgi:hypothetical protein
MDAQRFEVARIPGHDDLVVGLGNGRVQSIVEGGVLGHTVGRQDPGGGEIEGQGAAG